MVKPYWSRKIFRRKKTVEIRGKPTEHRGTVWVCESGSFFITGKFDLYECEGPLSETRWAELRSRHLVNGERFYGARTYAWYLRCARRVTHIPCVHTSQVTWVKWRSLTATAA